VLAAADCKLWVMERRVYAAIKRTYVEQLSAQKRALIAAVPMLAVLSLVRPAGRAGAGSHPPACKRCCPRLAPSVAV